MALTQIETSAEGFRAALGAYAASVNVVTMWDADGRPQGATVTAFSSVSIEPLLVLVCVNRAARSFARIAETGRLGINLLGSVSRGVSDYCSKPGADKELDAAWLSKDEAWRSPALAGALVFLDCSVDQIVTAGTHGVVICAVDQIGINRHAGAPEPLLHFRGMYRQLDTDVARAVPRPLPIIVED